MLTRIGTRLLAMSFVFVLAPSSAQAGPGELAVTETPPSIPDGAAKPGSDGADEFPKFDEITKDMVSSKGLFTLWSYDPKAKGKNKEKLLCQIPASFLGEQFMLSTSYSGGGFMTGFPLDERVVKWEILDKKLLLIEPNSGYVFNKSEEVNDVVRRTYPDRIRVAVPIVTKSSGGDPVIDLGPLLKGDFAGISWMSMGRGGSINRSLSKWTTKKSFELNVEIGVELAMSNTTPAGSYDKKMIHYSFWKLPAGDYKPRVADDRVGYFLTVNQDWSKPSNARDLFNRHIDRWHLVKQDTSLDLCEPKQPIIYYIEKTVPVRYRKAVRDGILEWNKAYEKVGFADAVQVRQQTETNEWKDLDPEDMRYSFFRWIVSGGSFAMGPHRANPFTGQIYDADIIFDDGMARVWEQQADRLLPSAIVAAKLSDPVLEEFLEAHPEFRRPTHDWETVKLGNDDDEKLRAAMRARLHDRGIHTCDYMDGMKQQMAVARSMLTGQPREVVDRFLYDIIKEVVMHEVGHTLGLRHNFKASTIYSLDEIRRRRTTGEPTVGSVMDYNPTLFMTKNALEGHFVTPTIGPYDYWAIEYGYRPVDGSYKAPTTEGAEEPEKRDEGKGAELASAKAVSDDTAKDAVEKPESNKPSAPAFTGPNSPELEMLHAIASRAAEPELAYATDEDTTFLSPDPRSNRFDMAADSIEWAAERIKLADDRLDNVLEWSVKDHESWYHARSAFVSLLFEKSRVLDFVGRYIGGIHTSRSHRGDPDARIPFEVVDAAEQRKALAFIEDQLFNDDFFAAAPEVLNHLAVPRWWHDGTSVNRVVDFPIHRYISVLQWRHLFDRLYPNTLRRIHDAELKSTAADKFTVAEYLQRIQAACWSETTARKRTTAGNWTDASPFISSVRRSLQREYINVLEPLVRSKPGDVVSPDLHAMTQHSLRTLGTQINGILTAGKLDFASAAHLTACQSRIERILAPKLDEYGMRF